MGTDSSPKKWSLKEQRAAYLQWFALADEGLLQRASC
jgi:EH domain-containing protein 1